MKLGVVVFMALAACGPGRQAAWEKEATTKLVEPGMVASSADARLTEADDAWSKRSDRAANERAIALLEPLVAEAPTPALLTKLARAYYFYADGHLRLAGEDEKMLEVFNKGVEAGEQAMMAVSPDFAAKVQAGEKVETAASLIPNEGQEAIYWYATNLGKFAVAKGFTTTLFYKDRIYAVMQRVLQIDENFFHAAPHRYFGAFYAKAPAFAGGDLAKSKQHFERALELDDKYFATKVLFAEYYAPKTEDKELFTRLLTEVTQADPNQLPNLVPEQQVEQEKAKRLLAQADELF